MNDNLEICALTTYHIPEYDEMHAALNAHDLNTYFDAAERLDDHLDDIAREVYAIASVYGCVMLDVHDLAFNDNVYTRRQYRQYLHRSARYPGCLQLTSWDYIGPMCDVRISDADDLCDELRHSVRNVLKCMYGTAA